MTAFQAVCQHCGASFAVFSEADKNLTGVVDAMRNKHAFLCRQRTPAKRHAWAKRYERRTPVNKRSMTFDFSHPGMKL